MEISKGYARFDGMADAEALRTVFSDSETFTSAALFMFLLVAVIVLAFGQGAFSLDRVLIKKTETTTRGLG